MTEKSENKLQPDVSQAYQALPEVKDQDTGARVVRQNGPGTPLWYVDTLSIPSQADAKNLQADQPANAKVSLKKTVNGIKKGIVNYANKAKKYLFDTPSGSESPKAKARVEDVDPVVKKQPQVNTPPVLAEVEEVLEPEPTVEEVVDSLANNITQLIGAAEIELEENNDILTGIIVGIAKELNTELRKEKLNWTKIDLLVRQLSVMLVQKMAKNDHKTIQEELDQLQRDIDKIAKTYKGKWEMALGIISGAFSIIGGTVGLAGGFGALGGVAQGTLKSLQGISTAMNSVGQGVGQFGSIARNANERDRTVFQYEMERDRGFKSNAEESQRNNRSAKSAHINQMNSAIEAAYRAFISVAS